MPHLNPWSLTNTMYKAHITVMLRPAILDPQGKAAHHALENLGFNKIQSVRIGKFVEIELEEEAEQAALATAHAACQKLLANPVMEDYEITLEPVGFRSARSQSS